MKTYFIETQTANGDDLESFDSYTKARSRWDFLAERSKIHSVNALLFGRTYTDDLLSYSDETLAEIRS